MAWNTDISKNTCNEYACEANSWIFLHEHFSMRRFWRSHLLFTLEKRSSSSSFVWPFLLNIFLHGHNNASNVETLLLSFYSLSFIYGLHLWLYTKNTGHQFPDTHEMWFLHIYCILFPLKNTTIYRRYLEFRSNESFRNQIWPKYRRLKNLSMKIFWTGDLTQ